MTEPNIMRRIIRGSIIALLVGFIATGVSIAPALFIQSVFLGSAQRCVERQEFEEAAFDRIETKCEDEVGRAPFWFPPLIIVVGGTFGMVGGFLYGFLSKQVPRRKSIREKLISSEKDPDSFIKKAFDDR